MTPRVAVVIPTCRRPVLLARCLDAVLAQDFDGDYEVIVVDDGGTDETRDLVAAMRPPGGRPVLHYLRPTQAHGPAAARNCGWRAAGAELIAFTDDDTVPAPDWLKHGAAAMGPQPYGSPYAAVCGRVHVPVSAAPTDHERMTQGLESAEFVTANVFVWRRALARVDGFDERFTRAWHEDSDLHFRLLRHAGPVGRCETAVVTHPVRRERWGVCLRQQRNAYFDALLYKKHPQLYRQRIHAAPPWNYYLIVLFVLGVPALVLGGAPFAAAVSGLLAVLLVLKFADGRLRQTARNPAHVAEMLATSALIPFLSVYWRLRGALEFRVMFL